MKKLHGHHPEIKVRPHSRLYDGRSAPLEVQLEAMRAAQIKRARRAERLARTVAAGGIRCAP